VWWRDGVGEGVLGCIWEKGFRSRSSGCLFSKAGVWGGGKEFCRRERKREREKKRERVQTGRKRERTNVGKKEGKGERKNEEETKERRTKQAKD
jgi:hypothetical protein